MTKVVKMDSGCLKHDNRFMLFKYRKTHLKHFSNPWVETLDKWVAAKWGHLCCGSRVMLKGVWHALSGHF